MHHAELVVQGCYNKIGQTAADRIAVSRAAIDAQYFRLHYRHDFSEPLVINKKEKPWEGGGPPWQHKYYS